LALTSPQPTAESRKPAASLNPHLAGIQPSLIRAINARKQPGDIDLGLGEPTLRPNPRPLEKALEWVRENGCPYSPNAGFPELRDAIVARYGAPGTSACVTVGSEEALYLTVKTLLDPARDEVLIPEPCYPAYSKICALEGMRSRPVGFSAESGFAPRADVVLEALGPDTRLLILASPANPTGRVWPEGELRALATGLSERPGPPVWVLFDEVYRELFYTPEPPLSLARLYPHTLVAGSLSKSCALTGLRLGWLIGPTEVIAKAVTAHGLVNTAAGTIGQRAALAVFREPALLAEHRPLYAAKREVLLSAARQYRVQLVAPEGAFYAMVHLRGERAAERLLEEHRVVTVPGHAFGSSADGWLRVSWVAPDATLVEGLRRIGEFGSEIDAIVLPLS
jgi:aspartate/methionine/tyrosine aminotransferase